MTVTSMHPDYNVLSGIPVTDDKGDAAAIIGAARAVAAPVGVDPEKPWLFVVPANARLEEPDLSAWRKNPQRTAAHVKLDEVGSFIDYVMRHHDSDMTTIWVDTTTAVVQAVIDDHESAEAHWREHRATLTLKQTPEWERWLANDRKMLGQIEFAEHIEESFDDIVEPDSATMLEIAQSFHAKTDVSFRSSNRLASGEQRLQYDENVQASAGAGDIVVPTTFLLGIAPFEGEDPYRVAARLRFRVSGGHLKLGYVLDRPERIRRDALGQISERLSERFPATFLGTPQ